MFQQPNLVMTEPGHWTIEGPQGTIHESHPQANQPTPPNKIESNQEYQENVQNFNKSISGHEGWGPGTGLQFDIQNGQNLSRRVELAERLKEEIDRLAGQISSVLLSKRYEIRLQKQIQNMAKNVSAVGKDFAKTAASMNLKQLEKWAKTKEEIGQEKDINNNSDKAFQAQIRQMLLVSDIKKARGGRDPYYLVDRAFQRLFKQEQEHYQNRLETEKNVTQEMYDESSNEMKRSDSLQREELAQYAAELDDETNKVKGEFNASLNSVEEEEPIKWISLAEIRHEDRDLQEKLSEVQQDLIRSHPMSPQTKEAKSAGLYSVNQGNQALVDGDRATAEVYYEYAKAFADIAVGLDPLTGTLRCAYESVTGINMITGRALTPVERGFAFAGWLTVGMASTYIRSGKLVQKSIEVGGHLSKYLKRTPLSAKSIEIADAIYNGAKSIGLKSKEGLQSFVDTVQRIGVRTKDVLEDFTRWLKKPLYPNLERGAIGEGRDKALDLIRGMRPEKAVLDGADLFEKVPRDLRGNIWDIMENLPNALKGDKKALDFINKLEPHELTRDLKGWTSLDLVPNNRNASPLRFLYKKDANGEIRWLLKDTHK